MFKYKPVNTASVLVSLITFLVFLPSLSGEFINQDDLLYVVANPLIRQLDWHTVASAFAQAHCGWWMPLTWLSFAVDYHFWGLTPFGYHLTNVTLHSLNACIMVRIADMLCRGRFDLERGNRAGIGYAGFLIFAGLLFAVHPLRVESVAWIAERKDVLNGLFAFAAIFCYLAYVRRKADLKSQGGALFYVGALLFFSLSLMAKSSSIGLPVMLLVLDWYPLGRMTRERFWTVLQEKIPFMAVAATIAVLTLSVGRTSGYLVTYEAFPFSQRVAVSGNAVWEYWRMFFLPVGISPLHVIPDPIPAVYYLKAFVAALALTVVFCCRIPWLVASALCFLLPIIPVLGFFQNGDQSFAARFTYMAALAQVIPLAVIVCRAAIPEPSRLPRYFVPGTAALVIAAMIAVTCMHFAFWQNSETYWTRVIEIEPIAINYKERGRLYHLDGRYHEAVADFTAALERLPVTLQPYAYNFRAFRAESLRAAGRSAEAVADYDAAIAILPHPAYFYHRGLALKAMGRLAEAESDFSRGGAAEIPIVWFDREL